MDACAFTVGNFKATLLQTDSSRQKIRNNIVELSNSIINLLNTMISIGYFNNSKILIPLKLMWNILQDRPHAWP